MPVLFAPCPAVPGQPMNFRAEAKSETSIGLSWSPPRQESIIKYELLFREGDHGREVRGRGEAGWRSPPAPLGDSLVSPSLCRNVSLPPFSLSLSIANFSNTLFSSISITL